VGKIWARAVMAEQRHVPSVAGVHEQGVAGDTPTKEARRGGGVVENVSELWLT
jgi:hypothetical protein